MNKAIALFIFTVTASFGYAGNTGGGVHKPTPKSNDSIAITTSNIAIFKIITTPPPSNTNNGSLKKAGKVARTSNTHPAMYAPPIHYVKPLS